MQAGVGKSLFLSMVSYILGSGTEYGYLILEIYKIHATGAEAEKQGFLRWGAGCVFVFFKKRQPVGFLFHKKTAIIF